MGMHWKTKIDSRARWALGLVLLMAMPVVWGCPGGSTQDGQLQGPSDDDDVETELDVRAEDFTEFDEDEEYSRPDYPVRRNPFRPDSDVVAIQSDQVSDEDERPREPLERFGLGQLELVTIISETTVPRAMFIDPSGMGHFAKEGDRIGTDGGVVDTIRSEEVEVLEGGQDGVSQVLALRDMSERDPGMDDRGSDLTDEEREALRRLVGSDEGQELLRQEMGAADGEGDSGLAPPERQ